MSPNTRCYPEAERLDLTETRHRLSIADPYRWLEDPADPRTEAWLAAQQDLFSTVRGTWPVEDWRARLSSLMAVDSISQPLKRGDRLFFVHRPAGEDHPSVVLTGDGDERVLLSPQALDPSGGTVLDDWRPSVEGDLLAYQLSVSGTEDSCLRVMDVRTGRVVDGPIDRVRRTPVAWLPGGTHYYYVRRIAPELNPGEERYHRRVYLHQVGTDPAEDISIFGEGRDKTQFYTVDVTADGRWLRISATAGADRRTDIWLADLAHSPRHAPDLRPVQIGTDARTTVHIAHGTGPDDPIWLRTTAQAPCGRIVTVTPGALDAEWRELVAERPGAVLTDFAILTGRELPCRLGLIAWTRHAVTEITVHDLADGREIGTVALPGAGSAGGFAVPRDGGHEAWFKYTDHRTPSLVLHYDGRTGETSPWRSPGASVHTGLSTQLAVLSSPDGTVVRMFIVAPAVEPDRPRPAILTGYGGFGVSMAPFYSPEALAWVRSGGVYAVACVRGGGEEGEEWHRAGRRENKQNVFDDFAAAADYLVAAGWTSHEQLGITGGSNGGLLVGAALTQHPEKYAAVVCASPLLDMARYELSGLGPSWRPEYGSAEDPDELRVLLSYSPYHHVRQGTAYPPMLFTVAEGDTRVDPMHARKTCAALQYASSGFGPVLFRYERGVGHGARALSRSIGLAADSLAFLAESLGLKGDL